MSDNIKQDINFLEYPLWMQSAKKADNRVVTWEDRDGYRFEASRGVPSKVDILFLYYLMLESQNNNWNQIVRVSRYQILKACGMNVGRKERERLIQSLEAWKRVTISFSGTFYNGTGYEFIEFGIVDKWSIREEDKQLEIRLSPEWIEKIRQSEFFKYVSFAQMKQLRSPLALRLYEILVKTLYQRTSWEIDALKLAVKIPMVEKYFTDIRPKIEAATRRISDKTDLNVKVKIVKQGRGKGKFIFTKKSKPAPLGELFPPPETPPAEIPLEILEMIPEEWRENAIAQANEIFKAAGEGELKACIEKINQAIKKGTEINSYGGYLRRCHDEKWHKQKNPKVIKSEKEAIVREKSDLKRIQLEVEKQEEQSTLKANYEALDRLQTEEPEKYAQLEKKAADALELNLNKPGIGGKMKITRQMFKLMGND